MNDLVLPTAEGGEATRLTVSPPIVQFEFVASNPLSRDSGAVASNTELYQLRHASDCSARGSDRVEKVSGFMRLLDEDLERRQAE